MHGLGFVPSCFFRCDISVICHLVVLKLAAAVFISLYFQTFWPKKNKTSIVLSANGSCHTFVTTLETSVLWHGLPAFQSEGWVVDPWPLSESP